MFNFYIFCPKMPFNIASDENKLTLETNHKNQHSYVFLKKKNFSYVFYQKEIPPTQSWINFYGSIFFLFAKKW